MTTNAWRPPYDFNAARPTFLDVWPQHWRALAPTSELVPLSRQEMNALGWQIAGFRQWFAKAPATSLMDLAYCVDAAVERLSRSSFIRLSSRSPKDSLYAQRKGLRVSNGAQALALITEGSERCAADLRMALDCQIEMAIVVRRWIDFPPSAEFRCFMVDRKWGGASQMGVGRIGDVFLTIQQARAVVSVLQAVMQEIIATSHIVDAVFDLVCLPPTDRHVETWSAILLDVNPLLNVTDLAHFSPKGEFDFTLRFHKAADGGFASIPLPGSRAGCDDHVIGRTKRCSRLLTASARSSLPLSAAAELGRWA
jgi:hypothetical protein